MLARYLKIKRMHLLGMLFVGCNIPVLIFAIITSNWFSFGFSLVGLVGGVGELWAAGNLSWGFEAELMGVDNEKN